MNNISSHNDNSLAQERAQQSKQSRVISTRNVIPYNRPVTKEDVNTFNEKRKTILEKKTDEEIKPSVARIDDQGMVIANNNINIGEPACFTQSESGEQQAKKIDYAAERERLINETPEYAAQKKTVVVKRTGNASV